MDDTIKPFVDDAVARIADRYRGIPETAAERIAPPMWHAYQQGRHDALSELMPVESVATTLRVTPSYVNRTARRLDIGWRIGRDRLYTPDDVDRLRAYMDTDRRRRS